MIYHKWINEDGTRMTCIREECENPVHVAGLCGVHYHRERKAKLAQGQSPFSYCPTPGCDRRKLIDSPVCGGCRQTYWRYGLSVEKFLEMMQPENRFCANPGCGSVDKLRMDHDHSCCPYGKFDKKTRVACGECVRGWLCHPCNVTLGQMQEDPGRIQGLLTYLERTKR